MQREMDSNCVNFFFILAVISVSTQLKGWRVCFGFQFERTQPILVGKGMVA